MRFVLDDHRDGSIRDYQYREGLHSYLREAAFRSGVPPLVDGASNWLFVIDEEIDGKRVEAVILRPRGYSRHPMVRSFANGEQTVDHGSHVDGLIRAFSDAMRGADRDEWERLTKDGKPCLSEAEAVLVGVDIREPRYAGATRVCLCGEDSERFVYETALRHLPDQIRRAVESSRAIRSNG